MNKMIEDDILDAEFQCTKEFEMYLQMKQPDRLKIVDVYCVFLRNGFMDDPEEKDFIDNWMNTKDCTDITLEEFIRQFSDKLKEFYAL